MSAKPGYRLVFSHVLLVLALVLLGACKPKRTTASPNESQPASESVIEPAPTAGTPSTAGKPTTASKPPTANRPSGSFSVHPAGDALKKAVQMYPDLMVADSALNNAFVAAVNDAKQKRMPVMQQPLWPVILAKQAASQLAVEAKPTSGVLSN